MSTTTKKITIIEIGQPPHTYEVGPDQTLGDLLAEMNKTGTLRNQYGEPIDLNTPITNLNEDTFVLVSNVKGG